MARKKESQKKTRAKGNGRLFIVEPTLDTLLSACKNVKMAANDGGFEYSNFAKTCKLEKDIRLSSLEKCAAAFGKDTLILHLPAGLIESVTNPKSHHKGEFYTIEEADLKNVLWEQLKIKKSKVQPYLELFFSVLEDSVDSPENILVKLASAFQKAISENGDK